MIILGAPHSVYRDLCFSENQVVVDVWGFWPDRRQREAAPEGNEAYLTAIS